MPTGGGTDRPTNHLTDRPMTDRSVVVVVVVAWGITRVFVAHNSASMRGYATHHIGLCHWVFLVSNSRQFWLCHCVVLCCQGLPSLPTLPSPSGRFNPNHPSLYSLKWAVRTRESSNECILKSCSDPASNSGPPSHSAATYH